MLVMLGASVDVFVNLQRRRFKVFGLRFSIVCISTPGFLSDWRKLSVSSDHMRECAV